MISLSSDRRRAVEALLNRLAGVQSARVETTEAGQVERIHVVSTGKFSTSQQARNVESALLAALNLDVDPGLITVVSLKSDGDDPSEASSAPQPAFDRRVRLNSILYQQEGFKVTAHAELGWEGQTVRGSHTDTDTAKGRMMAAARATIDALERIVEGRAGFFLEGLETHQTFERTIAVVALRVLSETRKTDLAGCAIVDEDANYAAAQAVLGAVNRSFLHLLMAPGSATGGSPPATTSTNGEAREKYATS
ncbi:MAG: hypothetical protein H0V09_10545 [Gemmatimonadetes bacterium]|nr:hypothetical protein [Gemmatimonadota bacterium]